MAGKLILVIDNNEDNITIVKLALEINSDWVLTASNGLQGVIKAELERRDAIVLYLAMPDLDGFTVCEVLKSNLFTRTISVIFMTARTKESLVYFKKYYGLRNNFEAF